MVDKNNMPQIRFAGFFERWTEKKLEDFLIQYNEVTTTNNQYPVLTSSRKGIFFQTDYYDGHQIASVDNTGYNVVPRGYFTYRHMSDDEVFHFNINDIADFGIVSTLYPVFTTTHNINSKFLQYKLNYGKEFPRYAVLQKQGGSRTYMYFNKLKNLHLLLPPTSDEQASISGFLVSVDTYISQHQSKLEKLENLKSSMIEKLFPKAGANIPEVRFKGFDRVWERKPAAELFAVYVDKGHPELPVLSATQEAGMVIREELGKNVFHEVANEAGYKRVLPGQFVIHLRSFQGGFAHSAIEGITSPAYTVFGFKEPEKHDDFFWKYVFMSKQFIKRLETVTYGIRDGRSISYDEFLNLDFLFPTKAEQSLICKYLLNLDSLISMRRQEIDKLQALKKGLLEKMFV